MQDEQKYKVLITIDPTEPELRPTETSLAWFKKWASERDVSIEAVFVSFGDNDRLMTKFGFSDYVNTLNLGKKVDSKILIEKSSSRRKAVNAVIQYSKKANDDLIVVSSHGRSGPGRLVLGSFAESLLATSPVPVLFLCEGTDQPAQHSGKILFPTDFSEPSKRAFDLFLEQLKGYGGEVILYHAVSPPGAIYDTGVMSMPVYVPESYWLELREWSDRESDQMQKNAISKGFKVRAVIQDGVLNTPMAIEKFAQDEKVDLIGMASLSRGLESAILGSVAKGIFRLRKWPVWVCGPETVFERKNK